MNVNITVKSVVQVSWETWNDVCAIPGLVSRANPGVKETFGNNTDGQLFPFMSIGIPENLSAVNSKQRAYHGDFILTLSNGKLLVLACPETMVKTEDVIADGHSVTYGNTLYLSLDGDDLDSKYSIIDGYVSLKDAPETFKFKPEDFPLFVPWKHESGNYYVILGYTNVPKVDEKSRPGYPVVLRYANYHTGQEFSGVAWDWHRRMTRVATELG